MNNIHDKIFMCPKCGNRALVPVYPDGSPVGIGWHEICICEECAAELQSEPQFDGTVNFVDIPEEDW